jgi:carbon monoxide dehydrogenase subunit G
MELKHSFTVPVPVDRAWDVLLDVERVAPCMPGATLDSVDGNDITGKIKVKVGPIAMTYTGKASFTERNREAGVVTLEASGKETRGAGTASATVRSELTGEGAQTHVTVVTNLNITGKPAQFGRGVMSEVSDKLIGIFADNLAKMLAAEPTAETASAAETEPAAAEPEPAAVAATAGVSADLARPIEELNLPVRAYSGLKREGVHTVGDLVARTPQQLLAIDNIGPASVEEIRQRLAGLGLALSESAAAAASANGSGQAVTAVTSPTAEPPADRPVAALRPVPSPRAVPSPQTVPAAQAEPSWQADNDAIDLLSVAGVPVLKRAIPVAVAGLIAAVLIALGLRRRRAGH